MNSKPADVDVDARWHRRDTQGAIRRRVIINNSAYCRALWRGWELECVHTCSHIHVFTCE